MLWSQCVYYIVHPIMYIVSWFAIVIAFMICNYSSFNISNFCVFLHFQWYSVLGFCWDIYWIIQICSHLITTAATYLFYRVGFRFIPWSISNISVYSWYLFLSDNTIHWIDVFIPIHIICNLRIFLFISLYFTQTMQFRLFSTHFTY